MSAEFWIPVLKYVEHGEYLIWASVCKTFKKHLKKLEYPRYTKLKSITATIELFEFALPAYPPITDKLCAAAIENGNLNVLQSAVMRGAKFGPASYNMAVKIRNFEILEQFRNLNVAFDFDAPLIAIRNRDLEMLIWLKEDHNFKDNYRICSAAAEIDDFGLLVWLRNVCDCFIDEETVYFAAKNKNYDMLTFLRINNIYDDGKAILEAGKNGDLEMVKFLYTHFQSIHEDLAACATRGGHLEIVKWAYENHFGCEGAEYEAYLYGQLEILKWLKNEGLDVVMNSGLYEAAFNGHLEIVKWIYDEHENCDVEGAAAAGNHINILDWLFDNKKIDSNNFIFEAVYNNNVDVLNWALAKNFNVREVLENIFQEVHPKICIWARENLNYHNLICEIPGDELEELLEKTQTSIYYRNRYLYELIENRRYNLLLWLVNHGLKIEINIYKCMYWAIPQEIHFRICEKLNFHKI